MGELSLRRLGGGCKIYTESDVTVSGQYLVLPSGVTWGDIVDMLVAFRVGDYPAFLCKSSDTQHYVLDGYGNQTYTHTATDTQLYIGSTTPQYLRQAIIITR